MANTTRTTNGGYGTTPVRNRKIGLADALQEQQDKNAVAISEPSAMVQQAAQQSYAMNHGGMVPSSSSSAAYASQPAFGGVVGKFEPIPNAAAANPSVTDFTDMKPTGQFTPSGGWQEQENMQPYQHSPEEYKRNFEQMESRALPEGWGAKGNPEYSKDGGRYPYMNAPYAPSQYASLSDALNSEAGAKNTPAFKRDETKKDGGFFGWLKSLVPKSRPGKREGETDDEYDARRTRNMQMVATLADAIRHMGNIVNTSKGAPLQIFNDPSSMIEQGRLTRKAERQKQAKLDADAALKQAEITLKERAAEADRAYKQFNMDMQQNKFNYQKGRDDMADKKWQAKFEFDAAKDDRDFQYKQMRDKVKDGQWQAGYGIKAANLNLSRARFAHTLAKDAKGGSGGSGYAYATPYGSLYSKKQLSAQQENQMWNFMVINGQITKKKQKEYELAAKGDGGTSLYGTDKGSTSRSRRIMQECIAYGLMDATEKGDNFRRFCTNQLGMGEDRVYSTPQNPTTWTKGASVTSQAAAAQNAAKAARNAKGKSSNGKQSGSKPKSKNGYKNTKALGL